MRDREVDRGAFRPAGAVGGAVGGRVARWPRVAGARSAEPSLADEPTSALGASVGAQVPDPMADIRRAPGLTRPSIGHDLATIRHGATRIARRHFPLDEAA